MTNGPSGHGGPVPVVRYRQATDVDARPIALLHADSWRRHYRGAYRDDYLDGDIVTERVAVWTERLTPGRANQYTVCAQTDDGLLGFAHLIMGHDPTWGALLDNLHVRSTAKGRGVGTRLMAEVARALVQARPAQPLYLWVLEQNVAAQSFYDARGGTRAERVMRGPFPGGGMAAGFRYVWPTPADLDHASTEGQVSARAPWPRACPPSVDGRG